MRITIREPNEKLLKEFREMHPGANITSVNDIIEIEVHWLQWDWWQFQWWRFNMWVCELLVPELKNDRTITFE